MSDWEHIRGKHPSLQRLMEFVQPVIEDLGVQIVDYWDGDLCAIGLQKGRHIIYINTYRFLNSPFCDVVLETHPGADSSGTDYTSKELNDLDYEMTVMQIKTYLQ